MEIKRIFDLLPHYRANFNNNIEVLANKVNGSWVKYSISDFIDSANNISFGLLALGIKKGDKVAIISSNRPEWNFVDLALLQIGVIPVPIFPTISESDYEYIFNHAEISVVFCEGEELISKIEHILPQIPSLKHIFTFADESNYQNIEELINLGKENKDFARLEALSSGITGNDIATIIYTSGTTGYQKGVMLSHANIISNFISVSHISPVKHGDRAISFLPLCHAYERILNYMYFYLGIAVYYAENMHTIAENIKEIQPGIFTTVPRMLEKIYDKIISKGREQNYIKRQIFFWAVNIGENYDLENSGNWIYKLQLYLAGKLVFKKWREALGGNIKVIVSGGATLHKRLANIYTAAGIPILEGYGLTETSPVIAVNSFLENGRKLGTVGLPLPCMEVKIAEDNEILCKGPNVMLGYFKTPDLTKEVIDEEGWFHTGDTGILESKGHLRLTGRKKTMFKTSTGKYVNPELIEEKFKESSFIDNIIVLGENQKFVAALIIPDFYYLTSYCNVKGLSFSNHIEMIDNITIINRFQKEVDKYNTFFGETEKIKKFEIIHFEWTPLTGELTPTLKLKRNYIYEKYKEKIDRIFL
ncbi:MAG: long-chain fatty acid--CoA ligase [Bacteroidetes bacterium]|nr:long-chain fatty acid--CoA ligase [Bacteroidota bacterium]